MAMSAAVVCRTIYFGLMVKCEEPGQVEEGRTATAILEDR